MKRFWGAVVSLALVVFNLVAFGAPAQAAIPDHSVQGATVGSTISEGVFSGQIRVDLGSSKVNSDLSYQMGTLAGPEHPLVSHPCLDLTFREDGVSQTQKATVVGINFIHPANTSNGSMALEFVGPSTRNYTLTFQLVCDLNFNTYESTTSAYSNMTIKASAPFVLVDERISPVDLGLRIHKLKTDLRYNQKMAPPISISWTNPSVTSWKYTAYSQFSLDSASTLAESAVPFRGVKRGIPPYGTLNSSPSWEGASYKGVQTYQRVLLMPFTEKYELNMPAVLEIRNGRWYSVTPPGSNTPIALQGTPLEMPPAAPAVSWTYKSGVLKFAIKKAAAPYPQGFVMYDEGRTLEKTIPFQRILAGATSVFSYKVKKNLRVKVTIRAWNDVGQSGVTTLSFIAK